MVSAAVPDANLSTDATFCDILLHTSRSCPDSAVGSRAVEVIESSPRGRLFGGLAVGLCSPVERHERLRGFVVNEEGNRRDTNRGSWEGVPGTCSEEYLPMMGLRSFRTPL